MWGGKASFSLILYLELAFGGIREGIQEGGEGKCLEAGTDAGHGVMLLTGLLILVSHSQ